MIISNIILTNGYNNKNKPKLTQVVIIKCDECKKEYNSSLYSQIAGFKKYNNDLCRSCRQRLQVKQGIRGKQYINAGISAKKLMKGKTFEEFYGEEKAKEMKRKISIKTSGENNPNYGGKYSHGFGEKYWLEVYEGKTWEQFYGKEKSEKIKKKISNSLSGEKGPMYGKPSPQGSGNGWSGWYKGWFFRSLKELSYMINIIERFDLKWEKGEQKKYRIEYSDWQGNKRTYHPDFLIEGKYLVEIKPKSLWNSDGVKRKKEAAEKWCKDNGFKYKLTECVKLIKIKDIEVLIDSKKIIFIKRYQEKYNNLKNNI